MTATTPIAIDESASLFAAMVKTTFPLAVVRWAGKDTGAPPEAAKAWFRWSMQHTEGRQASLACVDGVRRWRRNGLITVQCFAPLDKGGITTAQRMAEAVRDVYQGASTPSGVWYRRATTQEVGQDTAWYQVNTTAMFTYDEVR